MNKIGIAGAMTLGLMSCAAHAQDQAIPDAPRPQTVIGLGAVTPGKGVSSSGTVVAEPGPGEQPPVGSTLPPPPVVDNQIGDVGPTPDLPGAGQGPLYTIRTGTNFVQVPFTVKDSKGRLVPGLTWRDVRVYENGLRQRMQLFTVDPFPLSVAFVIDQSLPFDTMGRVNASLGAVQAAFTPYDEVAVFSYNNGPRKLTDFTGGQSPRLAGVMTIAAQATGRETGYYAAGEALSGGIDINGHVNDNITPLGTGHGPGTPQGVQQVPREVHTLNDAILEAAKALSKTAKGRRRIIYVISDGKEFGSQVKQKDVIKYLQTNEISVWATVTGDSSVAGVGFLDRYHLPLFMRDNILRSYTDATGGQSFAEFRTKGIESSFALVTEQVRTQYTVGYTTHLPQLDEKFRTLEVKVLRPNLNVISKKGYYPTATAAPPPSTNGRSTIPLTP